MVILGCKYLRTTACRRVCVYGADRSKASFTVHLLTLFSLMNAFHTFWRRRHYRLFENPLDAPPMTPSVHRVAVNSSPISSSPLRLLSSILAGESAESRSHPDATRDVWELAVWDPSPFALRMFCFFSPGHLLVYWLFLPAAHQDPRPSTTVVTTILLTGLLTAQLLLLQYFFIQQSKDNSIVHKEVLHEYDTKFVHPRTRPQVRDVGIQFSTPKSAIESLTPHTNERSVDTYSPTTIINKGFHPRPNPNYVKHLDPDHQFTTPSKNLPLPFQTPQPFRETLPPQRQPPTTFQPTFTSRRPTGGDGGSLGVYSHAQSPLRKAASTNFSELHRGGSPVKREGSPLKRASMVGGQKKSGWDQGQRCAVRLESGSL